MLLYDAPFGFREMPLHNQIRILFIYGYLQTKNKIPDLFYIYQTPRNSLTSISILLSNYPGNLTNPSIPVQGIEWRVYGFYIIPRGGHGGGNISL